MLHACRFSLLVVGLSLVLSPRAHAQPVETEMPGVTAELVELQGGSDVWRLAVRFVNGSASTVSGTLIRFDQIVLIDDKSKRKQFGLKNGEGHFLAGPISDRGDGGRWWVELAPKSEAILWLLFEPAKADSTFTVEMPTVLPFEEVKATSGASTVFKTDAAPSAPSGLRASLVSARRSGNEVRVRLKIEKLDANAPPGPVVYRDAYLFDPAARRQYPVLKDTDDQYVAQPKSDAGDGGRFWLNQIAGKGSALMAITFAAPPEGVAVVDVMLPHFAPLVGVNLTGTGGGTEGGAVAGRSVQIEGLLKELNADVTPKEIRINLSADVLFDLNKSDLKPEATSQLEKVATVLKAKAQSRVTVEGHTDTQGEEAYNQKLSEARAEAVRQWLVAHGIDAARIAARGYGESRPLKTGTTPGDHQANRRVEIRITGTQP